MAVLIVVLLDVRKVAVAISLISTSQDELAPKILLGLKLEIRRGDVRLVLQISLQLQACLIRNRKNRVLATVLLKPAWTTHEDSVISQ